VILVFVVAALVSFLPPQNWLDSTLAYVLIVTLCALVEEVSTERTKERIAYEAERTRLFT
jgi:hypothetical protein